MDIVKKMAAKQEKQKDWQKTNESIPTEAC